MITNYRRVVKNIRTEVFNYVVDNHLRSLVIGVSGGIDSALVCALVKPVCDDLGIPLIGASITIHSNKKDEIDRSIKVGNQFCHVFSTLDLAEEYDVMKKSLSKTDLTIDQDIKESKIRCGNLKARMRMITLYNMAQANGGLVLSTDNYTEYLVGFWTICGDVGDYSPIQMMWKTEVYEMSKWLVENETGCDSLKECINAIPTDGLGITNSDLDQLLGDEATAYASYIDGYRRVDEILKKYLDGDTSVSDHPVIKRHIATEFKRNHPHVISRNGLLAFGATFIK